MIKAKIKSTKGITLIVMVVTILVLIILAGVTLILIIGENGIIKKVEEAKLEYSEQEAKEKLELVLLDMLVNKETNIQYNKDAYLTSKIEENEMIVNEDIIIVDGWQFLIDRKNLEIVSNMGKVNGEIYYIRYDFQGGKSDIIKIQVKQANESVKIYSEKPIKDGYIFKGWSTQIDSDDVTYQPEDEYIENKDVVLYAVWKTSPVINTSAITTNNNAESFTKVSDTEYTLTTKKGAEEIYVPIENCEIGTTYTLNFTLGIPTAQYISYSYSYSIGRY